MGYLHPGHRALFEAARAGNQTVVGSVYVNPTQFGPCEDFGRYPRDLDRDTEFAEAAGVDVLFVPADEVIYPNGIQHQAIWVDPGDLANKLGGASRPSHFRGVATVVAKFFNLVQPDQAYFGQKDFQQAVIIRAMARDLAFPTQIEVVSTVREPDGLAMSSRNVYLSREERNEAPLIFEALTRAQGRVQAGSVKAPTIRTDVAEIIQRSKLARVEYIELASAGDLTPIDGAVTEPAVLAASVFYGSTRLIDNVMLLPPLSPEHDCTD
jgi:pantoate--beta-alanine ligase